MAAAETAGKAKKIKGPEAVKALSSSSFAEKEGAVDTSDPTGLRRGDAIEV